MAKPKAKPGMRGRSSIPMYDSSKDPDQEACAWRRPGWKPAAKTTSTPPQAGRAAAKAAKAPEGGKQKTNEEKRQKRIAVDSSDEDY